MRSDQSQAHIKKIFIIPKKFFTSPEFWPLFHQQVKILRSKIHTEERNEIRDEINAFFYGCLNEITDLSSQTEIRLSCYETLNSYAQKYASLETFNRVAIDLKEKIQSDEGYSSFNQSGLELLSQKLFLSYNAYYSGSNFNFNKEKIELLLEAKFHLTKIYVRQLESKETLDSVQLDNCLSLLSGCLAQLSRWFEPLYYIRLIESNSKISPNVLYLTACTLDSIKDKTCLDYNGLLILRIIDLCRKGIKDRRIISEQRMQLSNLENENRELLRKHKIKISSLRKHLSTQAIEKVTLNRYLQFCKTENLFLNEHSFFCNCSNAVGDFLTITTRHTHTQIEWTKGYQTILDSLIAEYSLARKWYYEGLSAQSTKRYNAKTSKGSLGNSHLQSSLIFNSFRNCYSILDKIGLTVLDALKIDYRKVIKNRSDKKSALPKVYFLSMWNLHLIEPYYFEANFYLISLYSIAKDLDKSRFAALRGFKEIRNAIEHRIITSDDVQLNNKSMTRDTVYIRKYELLQKTKLLLILTKSAILTYTYFVRRQSRIIIE